MILPPSLATAPPLTANLRSSTEQWRTGSRTGHWMNVRTRSPHVPHLEKAAPSTYTYGQLNPSQRNGQNWEINRFVPQASVDPSPPQVMVNAIPLLSTRCSNWRNHLSQDRLVDPGIRYCAALITAHSIEDKLGTLTASSHHDSNQVPAIESERMTNADEHKRSRFICDD